LFALETPVTCERWVGHDKTKTIVFAAQKDDYIFPKGRWMYTVYRAVLGAMNVMLEISSRNRLGKRPPTGPEFLVVVLVGCREIEIFCMAAHAVDKFLDVGF
jgi:hypothetical protein